MEHYAQLLKAVSQRLQACPPLRPLSEYNIFSALGVMENEVVMCRFLASLLNPDGSHGMGPLFLRSFFQEVLPDIPSGGTLLSHTSVETEFPISGDRRIDIVLRNACCSIPIEVKLNAGEQKGQCYDYYQYAQNAPLIYLTKFGSAPSEYSRAKPDGSDLLPLERIRCISWSGHICRWLRGLLPRLDGPVKQAVMQYIDAISHFTSGQEWKGMELEQSAQAALTSPEFFRAGLALEQSMKRAKVTLIRLVFDCFKEELEPVVVKYGLELERNTVYYSYEHSSHDAYYNSNASTYPGLNYVIKKAVFQKDTLQMWFRIEIDHNLFAGFAFFDTAAEPKYGYSGCQVDQITPELLKEASQYLDRDIITPADWWLAWCYPNSKHQDDDSYPDVPNFKQINQCAIDLVDPQKRREYIQKAVKVFERELLAHLL